MFPVDDLEWRKWMNQHFYVRQGVSFQEMTDRSARPLSVCCAPRSAPAASVTRNIMRLNETLAELTHDFDFLGEWLYFIHGWASPPPPSRGDGSSTGTTPSSITSCWATRW